MAIKSALYSLVSASALIVLSASTAVAGCGGVGNCDAGSVQSAPIHAPDYGPVTVRTGTPYDYMSSIRYQRAPHVQITRIHGQGPVPGLQDRPFGASGGCHDHATAYCTGGQGKPVNVQFYGQPQFQAPVPVMQAPVMQAPILTAPVQTERVVAIGKGYDPSKFTPRIYGDLSVTPGIAHVPTSIVDRNPVNAQAVLDRVAPGNVTPAVAGVLPVRGGMMPAAPMMRAPMMAPTPAPVFVPPVPRQIAPVMVNQGLAGAPVAQGNGTYASQVGADGTYWEKVSGVTRMGNTIATSVICKRKLPTQVVNPVIGVPVPVPTPVPGPVVDSCTLPGHLAPYEAGRRF
jgi:hypothetical protein